MKSLNRGKISGRRINRKNNLRYIGLGVVFLVNSAVSSASDPIRWQNMCGSSVGQLSDSTISLIARGHANSRSNHRMYSDEARRRFIEYIKNKPITDNNEYSWHLGFIMHAANSYSVRGDGRFAIQALNIMEDHISELKLSKNYELLWLIKFYNAYGHAEYQYYSSPSRFFEVLPDGGSPSFFYLHHNVGVAFYHHWLATGRHNSLEKAYFYSSYVAEHLLAQKIIGEPDLATHLAEVDVELLMSSLIAYGNILVDKYLSTDDPFYLSRFDILSSVISRLRNYEDLMTHPDFKFQRTDEHRGDLFPWGLYKEEQSTPVYRFIADVHASYFSAFTAAHHGKWDKFFRLAMAYAQALADFRRFSKSCLIAQQDSAAARLDDFLFMAKKFDQESLYIQLVDLFFPLKSERPGWADWRVRRLMYDRKLTLGISG